jgi:exopolysaccharide biosynthesis polyprenyl glycosylphosphotransferase
LQHAYASTSGEATVFPADRELVPGHEWHESRPARRQKLFAGSGWTALRVVVDLAALALGNVAALVGASAANAGGDGSQLIWLIPVAVCGLLAAKGLYRDSFRPRLVDGLGQLIGASSLASIALVASAALIDPSAEPGELIARSWLFGSAYAAGGRVVLHAAQRRAKASRLVARPTLIVGADPIGARVERRLQTQPELGLVPVGYLDADPPSADVVPDRAAPVLGGPDDLRRVARETGAGHVVVGFSTAPDSSLLALVQECEALGLQVSVVPRLFESVNVRVKLDHLGGLPLYGLHSIDPRGWQFAIKHAFDRVSAAALLVVLAPVMLAAALAVKLSSPGPVLFRQRRIGRDGHEFEILKFRSMRASVDAESDNVVPLPSDLGPGGVEGVDRRTRVGSFLRRTSVDELPQLLNVLCGDMSLVGPRPERPEFVDLFGSRIERYHDRHRVKSGITGWAQVHGLRGRTSLRDRVEWDNFYIENWSLGLDAKVLLMTVAAALKSAE